MKQGPIRCPETSVNNYHTILRNVPEERVSRDINDLLGVYLLGCSVVSIYHVPATCATNLARQFCGINAKSQFNTATNMLVATVCLC